MTTPTFLRIYQRRCEPQDFASLDVVFGAAEKVPAELFDNFEAKFGADILKDFGDVFARLAGSGDLTIGEGGVTLTRQGLLHVDRLLPEFFEPQHRTTRYT